MFQEDGELVSGFQDEVSLPRNREGLVWIQENKSFTGGTRTRAELGELRFTKEPMTLFRQ